MRLIGFLVFFSVVLKGLSASPSDVLEAFHRHTNVTALAEKPGDTNIVIWTSRILQHSHYLRQPIDDEVSSKFLDRYLDSLDNLHLYFLQSDLKQFERYRSVLDDLTLKQGDTTPARIIFNRFRERLEQQFDFVTELLRTETFDFTGNDRFLLSRKDQPRPKDMAEAKELWRARVRYEYLQEKLNKEKPDEIVRIILRRYNRVLRTIHEFDNDDVLQLYLTSLARVYDPHSDYMGGPELENFAISMKLSLFGIGALLRSEDGYVKIQELVPGGPAARSKKFAPNDKIIAVAQGDQEPVDVVDMKLRKVVEMIRGPKGTEVRLTVIPADAADPSERKTIPIIREEIKLEEQEAKAKLIEVPSGGGKPVRLGLIDLPSFYSGFEIEGRHNGQVQKSTTTDVAKLLKKLTEETVSGVILDLRRNGGGSLEEAINLTGLFIKDGTVVQVRDSNDNVFEDKDTDSSVAYDGPLIVLTSRFSASASEILAGALQDYGRALIVGDSSTHGKGTVQSLIQLGPILRQNGIMLTNNPGAVKITIRKFYRASGSSTQLKGVIPDIVLPSVNNHAEVGEASLDNPLPWDTIPAANYEKLNRVEPCLSELKKRSESRVAESPDFKYVRQEIERYTKAQAQKTISLNEAQRLKEKREADERSKARKQELASRPPADEIIYDINLKQALLPGLPPPESETNPTNTSKFYRPRETKSQPIKKATAEPGSKSTPDDAEDEKAPVVDYTLDETKRILMDYVTLAAKQKGLAETRVKDK